MSDGHFRASLIASTRKQAEAVFDRIQLSWRMSDPVFLSRTGEFWVGWLS
jgi:hypothetical protein